jgi:hypothetical protein
VNKREEEMDGKEDQRRDEGRKLFFKKKGLKALKIEI